MKINLQNTLWPYRGVKYSYFSTCSPTCHVFQFIYDYPPFSNFIWFVMIMRDYNYSVAFRSSNSVN